MGGVDGSGGLLRRVESGVRLPRRSEDFPIFVCDNCAFKPLGEPTMLDGLDDIPWKRLMHAYGPAGDVPDLLRGLRTAPAELEGEQSPLWHLFGNIWHQGSVYEATAYAVPFLIELAVSPQVPDRIGILQLLAEIATGHSYRDVNGNMPNEPDFAARKAVELEWVAKAHAAVANGVPAFLAMTEEKTDVRLAAAHVLAFLPERRATVGARLRSMVDAETGSLQRAGLLLLLGLAGDMSPATMSILTDALSGGDPLQRRSAALAFTYLNPHPMPDVALAAILEAVAADDLEEGFRGLPWDAAGDVDRDRLFACLDAASREQAALTAIVAIESGKATHQAVSTVLEVIFPRRPPREKPPLTVAELSALQRRAVRAMCSAMEGGQRIFYDTFSSWGLPETMPGWRTLASDGGSPPGSR